MKSKRYLPLMLTIIILMPFSALQTVKAAGSGAYVDNTVTDDGVTISYQYEAYLAGQNEYIDLSVYGLVQNNMRSAMVLQVQFDNYYTGSLTIIFNNDTSIMAQNYVVGDGASYDGKSTNGKSVYVGLVNCQGFTLIMASPNTNQLVGTPSSFDITVEAVGFNVNIGTMNYQIPTESVPAWLFSTTDFSSVLYSQGDIYPHLYVASGTQGRNISIYGGATYTMLIYATPNLTATGSSWNYKASNSNITTTITNIGYSFSGYRLFRVEFYNSSSSTVAFRVNYGADLDLIPLFFGSRDQMPDYIRSMANYTNRADEMLAILTAMYPDVADIPDILTDIYELLLQQTGQETADEDLTDAADDLSDIGGQINDVGDSVISDFDDYITDVNLNQYNIFDQLYATNTYFKDYLDDFFVDLADMKALFIVPVIVTILMLIVGWVI